MASHVLMIMITLKNGVKCANNARFARVNGWKLLHDTSDKP